MAEQTYITQSSRETKLLGEKLAEKLTGGDILVFSGNLGSGKTTFIQGLAKGLGIQRRIISPTFIIVRRYKLKKGNFYHVDLYRTGGTGGLSGLGINDLIKDQENIVAIEWGEKLGDLLPRRRIGISLGYLNGTQRKITIKKYE